MNRRRPCLVASLTLVIGSLSGLAGARADHQPVIAVPGHPQVPVIVNGVDATYDVVGGDWGLYAPGRVRPRVFGPPGFLAPAERGYYPATGRLPRYGRQEIEPAHRLPPPLAPTFYRSWSAESGPGPATEYPPYQPPPVVVAPRGRR